MPEIVSASASQPPRAYTTAPRPRIVYVLTVPGHGKVVLKDIGHDEHNRFQDLATRTDVKQNSAMHKLGKAIKDALGGGDKEEHVGRNCNVEIGFNKAGQVLKFRRV